MWLRSVGSVLIITGTAVGAGMLAIPLVTNQMGFWPAFFCILVCYAVMLSTALMILEVNLAFPRGTSFSTMAAKTLGPIGQIITWLSFCLLSYALLAAYTAGGGSLLHALLHSVFNLTLNDKICATAFMVFFGIFVFLGTRMVDYANRVLMLCKLAAFFILVFILAPHVQTTLLSKHALAGSWFALPILITSFGSSTVIPSVRAYVGNYPNRLRWIVFLGSTLPLVIYLLWITVTLGVLPAHGPHSFDMVNHSNGSAGSMVENIQGYLALSSVKVFTNFFSDIAITTSFLGVCMAMYDFLADGCHLPKVNLRNRLFLWVLTLAPPLAFALFYPDGFVMALGYASMFVAILLVMLPALMLWRVRKEASLIRTLLMILFVLFGLVVVGLQLFS